MIKSTTSPSAKASYRKSKIDKSNYHNQRIESLKRDVARLQYEMSRASK